MSSPPRNRAAFSRDDVSDAKRGHPDFDLREYAGGRGLEWLDHTTPAGYRAVVPGKEELQSNVLRGALAGGEYGVLAHESLEVGYSAESFDWGGTFYGIRVRSDGVGLKGMLPFSGRSNTAVVRLPCTVAGARLPESVGTLRCVRIDTRRSSPPFSFSNRVKLDDLLGVDGWSLWGSPAVELALVQRIVQEPVASLISEHAEDGLFQVILWWGTLVVRQNGFLRTPEALGALSEAVSLLTARLREVCLAQAVPSAFTTELPRPAPRELGDPALVFNRSDAWNAWAGEIVRRYGLESEDPLAYHRAFPSLPVPGQAAIVLRGSLAGVGDCRLVVHRELEASRLALLVAAPSGLQPTPPGGIALAESRLRVECGGDLLAAWSATSHWGDAMAGDVEAFLAGAVPALAEARATR